jgi:hypothetical protein
MIFEPDMVTEEKNLYGYYGITRTSSLVKILIGDFKEFYPIEIRKNSNTYAIKFFLEI